MNIEEGESDSTNKKDDYRSAISSSAEERISVLPQISSTMSDRMSYIVQDSKQDQINQQLWSEAYLEQYRTLLGLSVNQSNLLSNPKYFDESFLVYVDTIGRLPLPGTPIGIDGEEYSYPSGNLEKMCVQAQYIENVSRVSRKNIQNAFILYKYEVEQLNQLLREKFVIYMNKLREKYAYFQTQISNRNTEKILYPKNECDCEKDYTGKRTSIFNIIDEDSYSLSLFLSPAQEQWRILEDKIQLNDNELVNHGFYRVDRSHGECQTYKKTGKPITEARVNRPLPLQALKDTLEGVQEGEQGGCWFIDKRGLITGDWESARRIQLYQKIDYEYTIEDQDFVPMNNFKPMCAVFVTGSQDKWFFIWDWSEPSTRAICLEADLEFLYDSFGSSSNFFESNSPGRVYYADEESIQQQKKPRPVSARLYMTYLMNSSRIDGTLEDDEAEAMIDDLKGIRYDGSGGVLDNGSSSYNDYRSVVRDIVDKYISPRVWKYSMRIDNVDNEEDMGKQEWVNNVDRIRDSVGSCNKFACLKNVPKYVPDKQG